MRLLILLSIILLSSIYAFSQSPTFTISVSSDSVLLGNKIAVTFSVKNALGDAMQFPDFIGFDKLSGPNVSTSMSIMNGQMSQSASYTFYLEPLEVGDAYIEPAGLETNEGYLETLPQLIRVYPNPDGIIQQPNNQQRPSMFGDDFFGNDFFQMRPFGDSPFQGGFFNDLFNDRSPLQRDTIIQQPKKRKTTRI